MFQHTGTAILELFWLCWVWSTRGQNCTMF